MSSVGSEHTDVPVFRLPSLQLLGAGDPRAVHPTGPDHPRPIAFDPQVLAEDPDVVYMHLGSPLLQRTTRRLRSALWGGERSLERVSAMVVPGLDESFAVAVTRLVLVGRAGLRLHEEVFLAGTRLARRQAVGEQRAEELLEQALDSTDLRPVPAAIAEQLAEAWNDRSADGVASAGERRHRERAERRRRTSRAQLSSAAGRRTARGSSRSSTGSGSPFAMRSREAEAIEDDPQLGLFEDERRQSERDLREIRRRIDALDDERQRELEAVESRYDDVRAWEFPAAVVFAIAPQDVENGVVIR